VLAQRASGFFSSSRMHTSLNARGTRSFISCAGSGWHERMSASINGSASSIG
jgi:hypothetical protein